jgi:hypothetical protein
MMTDTRIYGYYLGDGVVVCPAHYDPDEHGRPGGDEGVSPLYSLDDDGNGLSCDVDGEYIFEPYLSETAVRPGWEIDSALHWSGHLSELGETIDVYRLASTGSVPAEVHRLDPDYGLAFVATVSGSPVAFFATPDHPGYLDDFETARDDWAEPSA